MGKQRRNGMFHDPKIDALLRRTSACMDGEELLDVAAVCADMVVFAISKQFRDDPEEARDVLEALLEAMRSALRRRTTQ
jgi:hypothetical protein